jgi:transcriptional regulator with XRE-family HTH domain
MAHTIRALRRAHHWSQLDLALRLHVAVSTVHKWESDKSVPHVEQFKNMATLFGVSMDDIEVPNVPRTSAKRGRPADGTGNAY